MPEPKLNPFLNKAVFFIGWLLSPLTFWNDAFVNIPIAYICATVLIKIWPADFVILLLVFYWLSNILGLLMMFFTGKEIIRRKGYVGRELSKLLLAMIIYSIIIIVLHEMGILRPI